MYEDKKKKPGGGKKIEGSYKKKGAAESVKQEKKDLNKMPGDVKQMDTPPARKKGGAKKKGSADYDTSGVKGSHDHPHGGAGRMGFTQNFGAARQNSYAQGAAKVASIMSFGASKNKGAADHIAGHPVPVTNLDGPDLPPTPRKNTTKNKYQQLIEQQNTYDTNTRTAMRNLAEIDSFKLATSNQGKMAKTLYGNNFNAQTTGLGDDDVFENRTQHVSVDKKYLKDNSLVKPRLKNMELLKEKAKSIQGQRPSSI